jgi:hypothetical protein
MEINYNFFFQCVLLLDLDDDKKNHNGKFKMSRIPKKGTTIPKLHKTMDIQTSSKRHMNRSRKVVNYTTKNQKKINNGGKDKALSNKTSNPSKRRASPSLRSEVTHNCFCFLKTFFFLNFFLFQSEARPRVQTWLQSARLLGHRK